MASATRTQRAAGARHRKRRPLRPEGRHRATLGFTSRWIVPVGLAVAILAGVGVLLIIADAII